MLQAYILIQTHTGKAAAVAAAIASLDGVTSVSTLNGPYDVIAVTRTGDIDELGQLILEQVQSVEGITRTLTCPIARM